MLQPSRLLGKGACVAVARNKDAYRRCFFPFIHHFHVWFDLNANSKKNNAAIWHWRHFDGKHFGAFWLVFDSCENGELNESNMVAGITLILVRSWALTRNLATNTDIKQSFYWKYFFFLTTWKLSADRVGRPQNEHSGNLKPSHAMCITSHQPMNYVSKTERKTEKKNGIRME